MDLKRKMQKFMQSDAFMIMVGAIAFFFWCLRTNVTGMVFLSILACLTLFFSDDFKPVLVIICNFVMVLSSNKLMSAYFIVYMCIFVPVLSVFFAFFVFKTMIVPKKKLNFGRLKWGMLTAFAVTVISGLGNPEYNPVWILAIVGVSLGMYFLYFMTLNTAEGDCREHFAKIIVYACFVILAEMIVYYATCPDFVEACNKKLLHLGWGMTNSIAVIFNMAIPMCFYLCNRTGKTVRYLIFAALFVVGMAFTFSRGNLLFAAVVLIPLYIYTLVKCRDKRRFVCTSIVFLGVAVVVLCARGEHFAVLFRTMIENGFSSDSRLDLYSEAFKLFRKYPILGAGFFKDDGGRYFGPFWAIHSTPVQIIASAGIVGVLGYSLFYIQRYLTFFRKGTGYKLFALASVLLYELYGCMDLTFFILYQIFYVFLFLVACERETDSIRAEETFPLKANGRCGAERADG